MGLGEYHAKRDFRRTREPRGAKKTRRGWLFVVQKHDASRLHYDFRLQLGDVLLSWAVPKGPSLDPSIKRLAMHVEDHPIDYGGFEGIIPEGEYGGGTVMLWDRGHWEPDGDAAKSYRAGKLKFRLHGKKLKGEWLLVRSGGQRAGERAWLLFKVTDEFARPESKFNVTEEQADSVKTGRTLAKIAHAEDAVWSSHRVDSDTKRAAHQAAAKTLSRTGATPSDGRIARKATVAKKRVHKAPTHRQKVNRKSVYNNVQSSPAAGSGKVAPGKLPGAIVASFSAVAARVRPQLATLAKQAPRGEQWLHEIKFDGYRMVCRKNGPQVQFCSRNDIDWTHRFASLVESVRALPIKQAILDGEVCALKPDGRSDFQELQNAMKAGRAQKLVYYAFDAHYAEGFDLTQVPLFERKQFLEGLLAGTPGSIVYSTHIVGDGDEYFREACKLGLEGMISKRADRPFYPGRSADWLKVKCVRRDEFVVGGYTDPAGSRIGFGSLLVGYYDDQHRLRYAGRVGTGFDTTALQQLTSQLKKLEQSPSPFSDLRAKTGDARYAHWVKPRLVAQVEFTEWTSDRRLRHPSFQGLREDKPADEVVLDRPVSPAALDVAPNGTPQHRVTVPRTLQAESKHADNSPMKSTDATKAKPARGNDLVAGVIVTSPDKVLYPEQGTTKLELAEYYDQIADWVMPELLNRPLVLVRCPEGRQKQCFYQKHPGAGVTDQLRQIPVREKTRNEKYLVADDIAGVVSLVQMGVLEIHAWGCRADRLEQPDRLIFDLDPDPSVNFERLVDSALEVREFLAALHLRSFVKTTGGKGLHVVVPIARKLEWDDIKEFTRQVATAIVSAAPDRYTANLSKKARVGKIFIDYLRNGRGASAIVPYSTRAREGCPISMPVEWSELRTLTAANYYNITNALERLKRQRKNPWGELATLRQPITAAARKRLSKLVNA